MARKPRTPKPAPSAAEASLAASASARAIAGGRVTMDREGELSGALRVVVAPPSPLEDWRILTLDSRTLDRVTPGQLIGYLLDLSPDVSKGQWDFSRMANAGWELTALRVGPEEVDERAQAALDAFIAGLRLLYGSPDVQFNRLFMNALVRGGLFSELVLDEAGREPVDLAVPDAAIVRFRQVDDPVRGTIYQAGQQRGSRWVPFDRPTVSYIPIDPAPGSPYGRPMISPAVFSALFVLSMLHDLRRVIAQQGYPRPDIVIELEKLAVPDGIVVGTETYYAWLSSIAQQIADAYAALEPDSAYVHTSATTMNRPVGTTDPQSLGGLGPIMEMVERQLVRALKSAPFMLGVNQSVTETQSNRQFEAYLQGIKSVQHLAEAQLERQFALALQAQGIVATVRMRFAENRAAELMRDAQTDTLRIANARARYDHGWTSQDEAAKEGADKDVADRPEPRSGVQAPAVPDPSTQDNPEPGADRLVLPAEHRNGHAERIVV